MEKKWLIITKRWMKSMKDEDFEKTINNYSPECIAALTKRMEEMAGAPREEMGKRTPGERGGYERQNIEKANRITIPLGYKVIDNQVIELNEEDLKKDKLYADQVMNSFIPRA